MKKLCFLMLICSLAGCDRQNESKTNFADNETYQIADFRTAPAKDTTIVFTISKRDRMMNQTSHSFDNGVYTVEWQSQDRKFSFICNVSDFAGSSVSDNNGKFDFLNGKTVNIVIDGGRKVFNPDPLPDWK